MAKILYGKSVAENLEGKIIEKVRKYIEKGITPTLCVVRVGNNPEAEAYANSIEKIFKKFGIKINNINLDENISIDNFINEINLLGINKDIHGILLLRPLSQNLEKLKAFQYIPPSKDVEGITYENLGKLMAGEDTFFPCTPQAVIELLDFYNIPIEGKNVVVVGRSISVGRPLSLLLLQRNATVTICHSKTIDLKFYTKMADILMVAVGKPGIITDDMVKENGIVIDIGTNVLDGKLVGDVDFESVKNKVEAITPVPGGVGVITTRILALNLLKAIEKNEDRN
uniref:Bifunctional protein FolD n=1 Tax=Dictyoglomus thermophilum TaxID=14 RepID=A0A7C3RLQ3_DICTH